MATIKVRQNGPYLVEGDDVTVVDWNGNAYQIAKRPFALCRCGGSTNKPFCDGTHCASASRPPRPRCRAARTNPRSQGGRGRKGRTGRTDSNH